MTRGEQAQVVLKKVQAKTTELNDSLLPKDVHIRPYYDRSELIALTTRTVEDNLLRGIIFVLVVLMFFLYDVRSGLIVATTIPLSLLFAFICLDLRHVPANLLSIGAIDFGIIVDGAVVMVENIFRQLSARREEKDVSVREVIIAAAAEVDRPDPVCGGGDHRGIPAHLRARGPVGHAVPPDGRYDDLRVDRLAPPHAHAAARALLLRARRPCARAAQSGLRVDQAALHARPRLVDASTHGA